MAITNSARHADRAAASADSATAMPLVLHLLERLPADGRENSLFKLLRCMPAGRYRHVVLALEGDLDCEIGHAGGAVQVMSLKLGAGLGWSASWHLYRLLRRLQPDLLHARSVRAQALAALAGIRIRLPSAQAGDSLPRRKGLSGWLSQMLNACRVHCHPVHGAIDSTQFHPRLGGAPAAVGPPGFLCEQAFVIGAAGPMDSAHDHVALVQAFLLLVSEQDHNETPLRLIIAGDGPCRAMCQAMLCAAGVAHLGWLPGARDDTARLMRSMDVFVAPAAAPLPGSGDTLRILEAMASGLPVVAMMAGAYPQLVQASWSGTLVPPGQAELLADAIADYYRIPGMARRHGQRGRRLVLSHHSLAAVAERYLALYDTLLLRAAR